MLPLRLVIDTNVLISAALKPTGLPRTVLLLALTKPARLYLPPPILAEYVSVMARPELHIHKGLRQRFVQLIKDRSFVVTPTKRLEVANDPDDNIFLECADVAQADYLITGNLSYFPKLWKKTRIIAPREFINLVSPYLAK